MKKIYVFLSYNKGQKMSSQSTKEREGKENLVVFHNGSKYFGRCIRGGTIHPFITYYYLEDYYKPIKTNSAFNGNYIKIMMGSETNDIIEELFESLQKYQEIL